MSDPQPGQTFTPLPGTPRMPERSEMQAATTELVKDAKAVNAMAVYPAGTPWWVILAEERIKMLARAAYFAVGLLIGGAPLLYEFLPEFKASMPASLFHYATSAVGALMLVGQFWAMYQRKKGTL